VPSQRTGTIVLIVGGGGREHALAWCLARSEHIAELLVGPGNAGTATEPGCRNIELDPSDVASIVDAARSHHVDLVVVGPEGPLVAGVVDALLAAGIAAFGPSAAAARLEGSKSYCKEFLVRHGIPTGRASAHSDVASALRALDEFDQPPVVKASGLAAGKGVIVAESFAEAEQAIKSMLVDDKFGDAGSELLLEERLHGTEVSVLAFCDGENYLVMPPAQDHKRLFSGDIGPNTGGMGAFVPSPVVDQQMIARVEREVIAPTLTALIDSGTPYRGVLYVGLMITADGPRVIEYNCRFGDPETQVVLPLLESDLFEILEACTTGTLGSLRPAWSCEASVSVVMASASYPDSAAVPVPISGLDSARSAGTLVFHAGTSEAPDGRILASGGRVLAVTAVASDLADAAHRAHRGVRLIEFEGSQHRDDIALATAKVRA